MTDVEELMKMFQEDRDNNKKKFEVIRKDEFENKDKELPQGYNAFTEEIEDRLGRIYFTNPNNLYNPIVLYKLQPRTQMVMGLRTYMRFAAERFRDIDEYINSFNKPNGCDIRLQLGKVLGNGNVSEIEIRGDFIADFAFKFPFVDAYNLSIIDCILINDNNKFDLFEIEAQLKNEIKLDETTFDRLLTVFENDIFKLNFGNNLIPVVVKDGNREKNFELSYSPEITITKTPENSILASARLNVNMPEKTSFFTLFSDCEKKYNMKHKKPVDKFENHIVCAEYEIYKDYTEVLRTK